MQRISAKDAKYGFGRLIDLACAEPVLVVKHVQQVVVVMSVKECERLKTNGIGSSNRKLHKKTISHLTSLEEA